MRLSTSAGSTARAAGAAVIAAVMMTAACGSPGGDPQAPPTTSAADSTAFVCSDMTPLNEALDELTTCIAFDSGLLTYLNVGRADGELVKASVRAGDFDRNGSQVEVFREVITDAFEVIGVNDAPSLPQLVPDEEPMAAGTSVKLTSGGIDYHSYVLPPDEPVDGPVEQVQVAVDVAGGDPDLRLAGSLPGVEVDLAAVQSTLGSMLTCEMLSKRSLYCDRGELGEPNHVAFNIEATEAGEFVGLYIAAGSAESAATAEQALDVIVEHGNAQFTELLTGLIAALGGDQPDVLKVAGIATFVDPVTESGTFVYVGSS